MGKFVDIGERLKEERERLAYNQTDFASLAGVGRKTQFNYEKGDRKPDAAYLAAVAEAGVDVAYVLNGKEHLGHAPGMGEESPHPYHSEGPTVLGGPKSRWREILCMVLDIIFWNGQKLSGAKVIALVDGAYEAEQSGEKMDVDMLATRLRKAITEVP